MVSMIPMIMAPPDTARWQATFAPTLEPLAAQLVDRLASEPLPPREREVVVVQSQGMRKWLTLRIADRLGCAGSLRLPFPRGLLDLAASWAGVPSHGGERFTRQVLAWRIERLLATLDPAESVFAPLARYLTDADDRRRRGLAVRLAGRFDDYLLFRADLLAAWEREAPGLDDEHAAWQGALWRRLCAVDAEEHAGHGTERLDVAHPATRLERTLTVLREAAPGALRLPPRLAVFGVSSLPPRFLELLAAIARHADVQLYAALPAAAPAHPLVEAFGGQGRTLRALVAGAGATCIELAVDPKSAPAAGPVTLLARLQHEIATGDLGVAPLDVDATDRSLTLHSAHGMTRELEVLRDQLLDAFDADPTLRPHDVLVLVPDVTAWRPTIEAVFSTQGAMADGVPRLPYRVVDRAGRDEPAAEAFRALLALDGGRMAHSELFAVLQRSLVAQGAGLEPAEIEALADLVHRANVRWGYDDAHVERIGLPSDDAPTWRTGLDRLLLGIATGSVDAPVLDLLPVAGDTAGIPDAIGRLSAWVDRVAALLDTLRTPRPLGAWAEELAAAVRWALTARSGAERASIRALEGVLAALGRDAYTAGHEADVPFAVVRDWLEEALDVETAGYGFVSGQVTFAALKPMRSIPRRMIALLGLDDATFPRRDRRPAFDLLGAAPRPGDRNLREDDRQLFLDLLLAAGDRLILSWTGRSPRDHGERAPSVVIDELLDHLERRVRVPVEFGPPPDRSERPRPVRERLVVQHPLHPFSERYLQVGRDPRLFTHAPQASVAVVARDRAQANGDVVPHFIGPGERLPSEHAAATGEHTGLVDIQLRDLVSFWRHPPEWFLRQGLQVSLTNDAAGVDPDAERLALGHLEAGALRSRFVQHALQGHPLPPAPRQRRRLTAAGELPAGALGAAWLERLREEVQPVIESMPAGPRSAVDVVVQGDGWRLLGTLDGIIGDTRYKARWKDYRARHRIEAWVEHVVLCAAHQQGAPVPVQTVLLGTEKRIRQKNKEKFVVQEARREELQRVDGALALLDAWVRRMGEGRCWPLPFFPNAGVAWLDAEHANTRLKPGADPKDAWQVARKAYLPSGFAEADADHPAIALCFRGEESPIESRRDEFAGLARALCPEPDTLPWGAS